MPPLEFMGRLAALRPHRQFRGAEVILLDVACGSQLAGQTAQLIALNLPFEMAVAIS